MNLVLLEPGEVQGGLAVLTDRRAAHVAAVLAPAPGRTLRVGVAGGPRGTGTVRDARPDRLELAVRLDEAPSPRPPLDLVLAVPRPKVLGRVLELAAAAGVGRLDLTRAWRVEKSYLASPALAPAALAARLRLGCEQGATTWVPEVALHLRLMAFLDGVLPGLPPSLRVVAHPGAERPLEAVVRPGLGDRVLAAVGPEGGFVARELDTLRDRGFVPVRLHDGVLRVEQAVAVLLGQLALLRRLPPG